MPLYRIIHRDGESVSTIALSHVHAANEIASYLYAKMIDPNLTNTRRLHPNDRIVCRERDEDFRIGDVVQHPFNIFLMREDT